VGAQAALLPPPPAAGTVARYLADFRVPCGLVLAWRRDDAPDHVLAFVDGVRGLLAGRGAGRRGRPAPAGRAA
jgi:hypothetical protein